MQSRSFPRLGFVKSTSVRHMERFQVVTRCGGVNGSRVETECARVKRATVIPFPRLIFFFSYWSPETLKVDLQPERNNATVTTITITAGTSSRSHRKEPGLATSGGQGFCDWLNLRTESKGPQSCSGQRVPWLPEPLWPPSAYSNRVS